MGVHPGFARLNAISICTGGGGLDLGLELAVPGYRPVAYVEREAFACAHLVSAMRQGLLAPAPLWSDARTFPGRQYRGHVDCIIGGIPCQPHSVAGKRLGRDDERDLWSAFRRILVQTGAWCALIENVPGMVTSGGLERVWRDLRRLGFAVEAGLFSAQEVGASHGRERLFVLAVRAEELEHAAGRGRGREGDLGKPADGVDGRLQHLGDAAGLRNVRDLGGQERTEQTPSRNKHVEQSDQGSGRPNSNDAGDGQPMGDAGGVRGEQRRGADEIGGRAGEAKQAGMGGGCMVDPVGIRPPQRGHDYGRNVGNVPDAASQWPLFAPGPDSAIWRDVGREAPGRLPATTQSTLRDMADGLAGSLDADRIDALRMLGNGVVPLAAAHAVRSLGVALARRHDADPAGFLWGLT